MGATKRMVKYQLKDLKKSLLIFWMVIIVITIGSYALNFLISSNQDIFYFALGNRGTISVAGALLLPVIIFILSYTIETYYKAFPISIGFSMTRIDFYTSIVLSGILMCLALAAILGILLKLDFLIIRAMGREPLVDFKTFNTMSDSIFFIVSSLFISLLTLTSIFNLGGVLLYRFGAIRFWGSYLLLGIALSFINISIVQFFTTYFIWDLFTTRITFSHVLYLLLIAMICYLLGYIVIRKVNVKGNVN